MIDGCGRIIDYMRISITDRCNFRCCYCMPEEGVPLMKHEDVLTYEEIIRIVKAGTSLGIKKLKVTGGEPLVRKNVDHLIKELNAIEGIEEVTMTTNGFLLKELAKYLKEAGLTSVNVSLDTLDPVRFREITRRDCFESVMEGIDEAVRQGLKIKINCAVMEPLKEKEILDFAEYSVRAGIPVRFIEMMPIGEGQKLAGQNNDEIWQILEAHYGKLVPVESKQGNGPAVYAAIRDHENQGCIGFISAVHHRFCENCNRVRLTCDGYLKLCLDSSQGIDLRTLIRQGISERELADIMECEIRNKPGHHHFGEKHRNNHGENYGENYGNSHGKNYGTEELTMNQIGG